MNADAYDCEGVRTIFSNHLADELESSLPNQV